MSLKYFFPLFLMYILVVSSAKSAGPEIRLANVIDSYSDSRQFGNPTGIFFDSQRNEIYLADAGNHQVGIFDLQGATLWTFKHWVTDESTGDKALGDPHAVVVTRDGDIIVSDNKADYLDIFDYRGSHLQRIETGDYSDIDSFRGAVLAIDRAGNIYIGIRRENKEIIKLDNNYQLITRFGRKGEEPQDFEDISGICIDDEGNILVTDALSTPVLKKFNSSGAYIGGFGGRTIEKNDFSLPSGVVVTAGGRIWVVDQLRQVVKCLTPAGEFITMIGGLGNAPGDMYYPSAAASDGDSLLIIAEKNGNRFQQFIIR